MIFSKSLSAIAAGALFGLAAALSFSAFTPAIAAGPGPIPGPRRMPEGPEPMTTLDMIDSAGAKIAVAERELEEALSALRAGLDEDGRLRFDATQRLWELYREEVVTFAADKFRGGSLAPVEGAGWRLSLTLERARHLRLEAAGRFQGR